MSQNRDLPDDLPFQAIVNRPQRRDADADDMERVVDEEIEVELDGDLDDQWTRDAIEEAYQRALEAADIDELHDSGEIDDEVPEDDTSEVDVTSVGWNEPRQPQGWSDSSAEGSILEESAHDLDYGEAECANRESSLGTAETPDNESDEDHGDEVDPEEEEQVSHEVAISLKQIVEALLFVGGDDLTTKRLSEVLGDVGHEYVDEAIVQLNLEYADQRRPYEIRLGEGGYRMALRYEYEKVRHRVFGIGPKEVKLSQESIEMLAFIAYRQPVTKEGLEEAGKKNAASLVRQLVLRELVKLGRPVDGGEPFYETTTRFLQLFGLNSIHDLPRPEQVEFR